MREGSFSNSGRALSGTSTIVGVAAASGLTKVELCWFFLFFLRDLSKNGPMHAPPSCD